MWLRFSSNEYGPAGGTDDISRTHPFKSRIIRFRSDASWTVFANARSSTPRRSGGTSQLCVVGFMLALLWLYLLKHFSFSLVASFS